VTFRTNFTFAELNIENAVKPAAELSTKYGQPNGASRCRIIFQSVEFGRTQTSTMIFLMNSTPALHKIVAGDAGKWKRERQALGLRYYQAGTPTTYDRSREVHVLA
jgi:hypothetical protein